MELKELLEALLKVFDVDDEEGVGKNNLDDATFIVCWTLFIPDDVGIDADIDAGMDAGMDFDIEQLLSPKPVSLNNFNAVAIIVLLKNILVASTILSAPPVKIYNLTLNEKSILKNSNRVCKRCQIYLLG